LARCRPSDYLGFGEIATRGSNPLSKLYRMAAAERPAGFP
jgi:hypothetical protein